MSGRLSNLSLSRVDWARHRKLVDLIAGEREKPGVLAPYLRSLELAPVEGDDWTIKSVEEHKARMPFLEMTSIRAILRADPSKGSERAAELLRSPQGSLVEEQLLQLGLVDPAGDHWNGDVWLNAPELFLAWFSPSFRESVAGCLREPGAWKAPDKAPAGDVLVEEALGGVFVNAWSADSIHVEPGDAIFDPPTVARIAKTLGTVSVGGAPRGADPDLLVRYVRESSSGRQLDVAEDAEPAAVLEALREWVQELFDAILELYADAASKGQALEVCWHPNP